MWMWSIFGSYRYEWILKKINKAADLNNPIEDYYSKLRYLLNSWNPCSEKLFHLKNAIEEIPHTEIFSLRLIIHCMKSLTIDSKHFIAWEIIDLMNSRILKTKPSLLRRHCHVKNLEQIASKMPNIDILTSITLQDKIQNEIEKAKSSFLSRVEESAFKVFKIMIRLLENMKSMDDEGIDDSIYGRSEFYEINFNPKITLVLLFFKNNWRINSMNTLFPVNIAIGESQSFTLIQ